MQRCSSNNSQAVCIELPSKQPACTTQAWEVCEMPPAKISAHQRAIDSWSRWWPGQLLRSAGGAPCKRQHSERKVLDRQRSPRAAMPGRQASQVAAAPAGGAAQRPCLRADLRARTTEPQARVLPGRAHFFGALIPQEQPTVRNSRSRLVGMSSSSLTTKSSGMAVNPK